jgi:hypothetical protein
LTLDSKQFQNCYLNNFKGESEIPMHSSA